MKKQKTIIFTQLDTNMVELKVQGFTFFEIIGILDHFKRLLTKDREKEIEEKNKS